MTRFVRDKAVITSALPYANGEIHLGHVASTYLPADVTTRFLKQRGVQAYYICASDDFGTPILIQSEKENKTPQEYAGYWNRRDCEDFAALNIDFDMFYRTSSAENVAFVQDVFRKLYAAGHIYRSDIIQFYCENDGKFLPDRYVKGRCPHCGAEDQYSDQCEKCGRVLEGVVDPRCSICGQTPVKKGTAHYFFRLKNFAEPLRKWLDANTDLQKDAKRYVQNWIKDGLTDWDITRDITWGVDIPLDEARGKVLYGWFDNHLAYISTAVKFLDEMGLDGKEFWNSADIYHFIGKDIVYHHYLFLPAMRLGIGEEYKLPDYIPTRGHLTLESRKISKSRGWYIGLREFLKYYPADYLRFYLTIINPYSQDDLNFSWDEFAGRINTELIGNAGNFVNRALGFTSKSFGGVVPERGPLQKTDDDAVSQIQALAARTGGLMEQGHLDRALKSILEFSAHFNQYFQHSAPWKMGPGAGTCVHVSVNAVASMAVALYPFLPGSAGDIWRQLGMQGDVSGMRWADMSRMLVPAGHRLGAHSPLFAKVDDAGIKARKDGLRAQS